MTTETPVVPLAGAPGARGSQFVAPRTAPLASTFHFVNRNIQELEYAATH
jgi:hypothetical protein